MTRLSDGDHPDSIRITHNRSNAALELVADLITVIDVDEWPGLAQNMMDYDLLADDEWWYALARRRSRRNQRPVDGSRLPSYSTRMAAGFILRAVLLGHRMALEEIDQAATPVAARGDVDAARWTGTVQEARAVAYRRSGGFCEAEGLHHANCPGSDAAAVDQFVIHHRYPKELAKRNHITDHGLIDHPTNLLVVWNGYTRKGAGGCHGKIHRERRTAKDLGHLCATLAHLVASTPQPSP